MKKVKKMIVLAMMMMLLVCVSVMGTLAYLTSQKEVTNTFTVGDVEIGLDETKMNEDGITPDTEADRVTDNKYHLMPGREYKKDPKILIQSDSEPCYVFVKLENGLSDIIDENHKLEAQMIANGWSLVDGYANIYKQVGVKNPADIIDVFETLNIATGVDELDGYEAASIIVTACAIQADGFENVGQAAAELPTTFLEKAITTDRK